jgi:uncharacterized protein (DUF362 family)
VDNLTRREFLRRMAALGLGTMAGTAWLSACSTQPVPTPIAVPPTAAPLHPTATAGAATMPTLFATRTALPPTAPATVPVTTATTIAAAPEYPHLAVVRNGEPEELVRRALAALGGMERFVRRGDDVIVKPNICVGYHTYEYAATTNPWVVGAVVRLCLEAGARRVRVLDQPFASGPEEAYRRSGIEEQVRAAGGQMEIMGSFKFVSTEIPQGVDIKKWDMYEDALKADVLIDVPIAKHHSLARLTLGMKNLMGLIRNRSGMHSDIGQRLADITSRFRPALTIVDAVRILTANGPTGGNLNDVKTLNALIASPDIVAADSYAATLFGLKPADLAYVRAGTTMGLGRSDLDNLRIEEITIVS